MLHRYIILLIYGKFYQAKWTTVVDAHELRVKKESSRYANFNVLKIAIDDLSKEVTRALYRTSVQKFCIELAVQCHIQSHDANDSHHSLM